MPLPSSANFRLQKNGDQPVQRLRRDFCSIRPHDSSGDWIEEYPSEEGRVSQRLEDRPLQERKDVDPFRVPSQARNPPVAQAPLGSSQDPLAKLAAEAPKELASGRATDLDPEKM
jgi:hypothetical protein